MYGQAGAGGGTVSGAQGQGTSQPTDRSRNEIKRPRNGIAIS